MPIDSKECFAALTEDGQLWEIYQAAQTGGGSPTGPAGGDLAGTYPNPTVDGLQGNPVSNATPVNGQVLQFDGTNWVPGAIPSGGSGGGGVVYFLNLNTAADAPLTNIPQAPNASKELGIVANAVTTSYTSPILSTASYNFLASFVTDLNVPAATAIPAGLWDFNIWAESTTTNTSNHIFYKIEVLKYDGVNAPVLLATSADNYIYDPQDITQYVTSIVLPQTTILATDRIVVYLYGKATQNNNTITFHFGGQYPSHTHSTMPSVTGTGVVKVINGVFQSPATTIVDADVSATANIAQSKIANLTTDLSNKVSRSGDTMTGKLIAAADATISKLNIGGSISIPVPATTVDGDLWITNQNRLSYKANNVVIGLAGLTQTNTFNQPQAIGSTSNSAAVLTVGNTGSREAAVFNAQGTSPAVRITQTGTGESFRVEDETTPDSTAFVISNSGKVGAGVTPDATVVLSVDTTGIKFGDNTIQTTAAVSGIGGSVGTVDNSVLRADVGTGIVQNSGIIIDDAIVSFAVTGDATTDIITATGSAFPNDKPVRFTALTGGTGLTTTTNYYVINVSGATFQVSTSIAGPASLFTTNITAGTLLTGHSVQFNVTLSENTTETNSALVLTPKGTGAFILGPKPDGTVTGGNARGENAVDLQTLRGISSQVAFGEAAFIGSGTSNIASNLRSVVVGGNGNASSGTNSFIGAGRGCLASGTSSVVVGGGGNTTTSGNTASAENTGILSGIRAIADRLAMQAHASGTFAVIGDAQRARFVMRCKTTTNTAVEMALDGVTTYLGIPSGKVISCTINISGVKSDGSAVAHYVRQYAVKNVGGTSSEVYAPVTIGSDNAAGTTIALSANNADDTLRITVTGIAAETWRWVASVDAVEIAYGT